MVYPYNETVLSNEKQSATDTSYNLDEFQQHTKWKKPDAKHYIPYASTYMKYLEMVNLYRQKAHQWLSEAGDRSRE